MPSQTAPPFEPLDLVLHVGSGKTGTSSVQLFLHRNRKRLAQLGLLFPESPGKRRHIKLGLLVRPDDALAGDIGWGQQGYSSPDQFRRDVERNLFDEIHRSGLSRVLLSDEALYGAPDGSLHRLRELTDRMARSVRLVVYLRRQDDHMCSRYQEVVKIGEVRRMADRVRAMDLSRTYDYHARLSAWREVLDPTELVVRRFEPAGFRDGSLHQDFLDAVGLDVRADELAQVPRANESLDAEAVEFLRLLNLYRVEQEGATPGLIRNRRLLPTLVEHSTGPTLTLPEHELDRFMSQWEKSNRAVAQDFFAEPDQQLFRSPRRTKGTTTEQRLDPARLDHFLDILDLPGEMHAPLRRIAEREAAG